MLRTSQNLIRMQAHPMLNHSQNRAEVGVQKTCGSLRTPDGVTVRNCRRGSQLAASVGRERPYHEERSPFSPRRFRDACTGAFVPTSFRETNTLSEVGMFGSARRRTVVDALTLAYISDLRLLSFTCLSTYSFVRGCSYHLYLCTSCCVYLYKLLRIGQVSCVCTHSSMNVPAGAAGVRSRQRLL